MTIKKAIMDSKAMVAILLFCFMPFLSFGDRTVKIHLCNEGIFRNDDTSIRVSLVSMSDTILAKGNTMNYEMELIDKNQKPTTCIVLVKNKKYSIAFEMSLFTECEPYHHKIKVCINKAKCRKYNLIVSYCNSVGDVIVLSKRQIRVR